MALKFSCNNSDNQFTFMHKTKEERDAVFEFLLEFREKYIHKFTTLTKTVIQANDAKIWRSMLIALAALNGAI
ncbi:MAG: hypothetical protein WC437_04885 [Patescibacteria group bacterium]